MAGESNGWREVLLGDVADELTVGHVGPMANEYVESGVPFLRSKNVDRFNIDWGDMRYISRQFHGKLKKSALSPGDVVIVRTGKPGAAALIPDTLPESNCSDLVIVRCGQRIDRRFLVYYLNSAATDHINARLVGAVQQHFNVGAARELRMKIPPLSEQKAIAGILGALDDKIEQNRRMNETLEEMARAIYKSWFVDFDPVRAKMDGRQPPGLSADLAALFPNSFEHVNGELIPSGWRVGRLDDLLVLQRGFDLPKKNRTSGKFSVFAASGLHGTHIEAKVKGPGVVTGRSGVLGKVFYIQEDFWPLNTTLWVKEYRASRPIHAYHYLKTITLEGYNAGSAVPTLNRNHVHVLPVVVPLLEVVEQFESLAQPLFERIYQNDRESETLAALRDTLLPKLLSGELRLGETPETGHGMLENIANKYPSSS